MNVLLYKVVKKCPSIRRRAHERRVRRKETAVFFWLGKERQNEKKSLESYDCRKYAAFAFSVFSRYGGGRGLEH